METIRLKDIMSMWRGGREFGKKSAPQGGHHV
jgi:hypothetical protein